MRTHKANVGYMAMAKMAKDIAPKSVDALDEKVAKRVAGPERTDEKLFADGGWIEVWNMGSTEWFFGEHDLEEFRDYKWKYYDDEWNMLSSDSGTLTYKNNSVSFEMYDNKLHLTFNTEKDATEFANKSKKLKKFGIRRAGKKVTASHLKKMSGGGEINVGDYVKVAVNDSFGWADVTAITDEGYVVAFENEEEVSIGKDDIISSYAEGGTAEPGSIPSSVMTLAQWQKNTDDEFEKEIGKYVELKLKKPASQIYLIGDETDHFKIEYDVKMTYHKFGENGSVHFGDNVVVVRYEGEDGWDVDLVFFTKDLKFKISKEGGFVWYEEHEEDYAKGGKINGYYAYYDKHLGKFMESGFNSITLRDLAKASKSEIIDDVLAGETEWKEDEVQNMDAKDVADYFGYETYFNRQPFDHKNPEIVEKLEKEYSMSGGGEVETRYHILVYGDLSPLTTKRQNKPTIFAKVKTKSEIKQKVNEAKQMFENAEILVTDDKEDREIYNYAKGGDVYDDFDSTVVGINRTANTLFERLKGSLKLSDKDYTPGNYDLDAEIKLDTKKFINVGPDGAYITEIHSDGTMSFSEPTNDLEKVVNQALGKKRWRTQSEREIQQQAIYEWNTMDRFVRADFLDEIDEDLDLGESRFQMKAYKYDDLPKNVQEEVVKRLGYDSSGSNYADGGKVDKYKYSPMTTTEDFYEMDSYVKGFYDEHDLHLESEEVNGIYPINVNGKRQMNKDEGYVVKKGNKFIFMTRVYEDEGKYADGGEIDMGVVKAIFDSNESGEQIQTSRGKKSLEGLSSMIGLRELDSETIAKSIFTMNSSKGKISTDWGDKTLEGLTSMIQVAREDGGLKYADGGTAELIDLGKVGQSSKKLSQYSNLSDDEVIEWAKENDLGEIAEKDIDGKLKNRNEILVYILELNIPNTDAEGNFLFEEWDDSYGDYAKGGKIYDLRISLAKYGKFSQEDAKANVIRDVFLENNGKVDKNKWDKTIKERPTWKEDWEDFKEFSEIEVKNGNYINPYMSSYAKGGEVDYAERKSDDFKLGELVYDTRNKRYGTIIGIYGEAEWEVRLDSDGMQPTEYLRKLGEKGDKGTKKQLFEGVSSIERLRKKYPDNNYPRLINNPFYAKGGKTSIREKRGYQYIPKKAIKNLTAFLSGKQLTYQGASLLSGVYVKKQKGTAKKSTTKTPVAKKKLQKGSSKAEGVKAKIMAHALSYDKKNKEYDKFVKTKDIDALLSAGLTENMIMACYCGVRSVIDFKGDYEMSELDGIFSMRTDGEIIERIIKDVLDDAKNKSFQMGMKYPTYNWSFLGNTTSKPALISSVKTPYGSTYKYKIWKYNKLVLGKNVGVTNKEGEYSDWLYGEDEKKLKLSGGYVGAVSSDPKKLWNLIYNLAKQKKGYVKDVDFLFNGLGGIEPTALDQNKIKYMHGGYIESMGPDFDSAIEKLTDAFQTWKEGPGTNKEDIEKAKSDILEWVKQKLDGEVTEINIYELKSAGTLTSSIDVVKKISKTRSEFVDYVTEEEMSGTWDIKLKDYPGLRIFATPFWEDKQGTSVAFRDSEDNNIYLDFIESPGEMGKIKTYQDLFSYYVTKVLPWIKEAVENFSANPLNIPYMIELNKVYDIWDPGTPKWTEEWKYVGKTDDSAGKEWIDEAIDEDLNYFNEIFGTEKFFADIRVTETGDIIQEEDTYSLNSIVQKAKELKNGQELVHASHQSIQKSDGKWYRQYGGGPGSSSTVYTSPYYVPAVTKVASKDLKKAIILGLWEDLRDNEYDIGTKYIFASQMQFELMVLLFTESELTEYLSNGWIRERDSTRIELIKGGMLTTAEGEKMLDKYSINEDNLDDWISEQGYAPIRPKKTDWFSYKKGKRRKTWKQLVESYISGKYDCGGAIYKKGDVVKCGKKGGIIERIVGDYAEIKFDEGDKDYVSLTKVSS